MTGRGDNEPQLTKATALEALSKSFLTSLRQLPQVYTEGRGAAKTQES